MGRFPQGCECRVFARRGEQPYFPKIAEVLLHKASTNIGGDLHYVLLKLGWRGFLPSGWRFLSGNLASLLTKGVMSVSNSKSGRVCEHFILMPSPLS